MYTSVEPVGTSFFSITWECTLKCNLDCSYCSSHDNSVPHPSLADCLQTIDFLYEYVDTYMSIKNPEFNHASFNIFGGESLFHPDIVEIVEYAYNKHRDGNYRWTLGINTVTNGIVKTKVWERLVDYFDYFTVSHHSEASLEEQELLKQNILYLKEKDKKFQVSILYHPGNMTNCMEMIAWCKKNDINHWARKMDTMPGKATKEIPITIVKRNESLSNTALGRSCCGGQSFNVNQDYENTVSYIENNNFKDWYCSVNQYFVFVKQVTKEVFINKDCRMAYDGEYGPIGTLDDPNAIITELKDRIAQSNTHLICKKERCWCGLCTPKAKDKITYDVIMSDKLRIVS